MTHGSLGAQWIADQIALAGAESMGITKAQSANHQMAIDALADMTAAEFVRFFGDYLRARSDLKEGHLQQIQATAGAAESAIVRPHFQQSTWEAERADDIFRRVQG